MRGVAIVVALIGCGRIGFDPIGPEVRVTINGGAKYAAGPRLDVAVDVRGGYPPFEIELAPTASDGSCVPPADAWVSYSGPITAPLLVLPVEGEHRACAFARDARGDIREGNDTIILDTTPPIIGAYDVVNASTGQQDFAAGDPVRVTFHITDNEALADGPAELSVATQPDAWVQTATAGTSRGAKDYSGETTLTAPAGAFRVKLVARDAAGNTSLAGISDVQNGAGWTVYLGSRDIGVGGGARGLRLLKSVNGPLFAIDSQTSDVYAVEYDAGLIAYDARTGQTRLLIGYGQANLPADGPLPADATTPETMAVQLGPDRKLYIATGQGRTSFDGRVSAIIYQLDLATNRIRRYVGGGTAIDDTATPATAFAYARAFTFDEQGTLYFLTNCVPGTFNASNAIRMMKVTQNPDGSAGTVSVVAGNCTIGTPPRNGSNPRSVPLATNYYPFGSIAAWDAGRVIYYSVAGDGTWKIVDGQLYGTDIPTQGASLAYSAARGTLAYANGPVVEYAPSRTGPGGETVVRTIVRGDGTGRCIDDGVPADAACTHAALAPQPGPDGRFYFVDGPSFNESRTYRVRFVDDNGTVRTLLGSPPLEDGRDRRLTAGRFYGIAYKDASQPNLAAFPAGLYFVDPAALVLAHVDPATDRVVVDWGNQSGEPVTFAPATTMSRDIGLGVAYNNGNLFGLVFDSNGFPILRAGPDVNQGFLFTSNAARHIVPLSQGTVRWEQATDATNPASLDLWPYVGIQNLALAPGSAPTIFTLGGYSAIATPVMIRSLDFAAGTSTRLIGTLPDRFTADITTPGTVTNGGLVTNCHDSGPCYLAYRTDQDRLYFSELQRVRYITTPRTPATSTLVTLFTNPTGNPISNFTFHPNGSQLFYIDGGALRCHDLGSGAAWCNEQPLGPPAVLTGIGPGSDQFTWRDASHLLISTFVGEVYEYTLPP